MSTCDMIFRLGRVYEKLNKNVVLISAGTIMCIVSTIILNKNLKAQDEKIKKLSDEIKELKNAKGE